LSPLGWTKPSRISHICYEPCLLGSLWPGLAVVRSCSPVVLQMRHRSLSGGSCRQRQRVYFVLHANIWNFLLLLLLCYPLRRHASNKCHVIQHKSSWLLIFKPGFIRVWVLRRRETFLPWLYLKSGLNNHWILHGFAKCVRPKAAKWLWLTYFAVILVRLMITQQLRGWNDTWAQCDNGGEWDLLPLPLFHPTALHSLPTDCNVVRLERGWCTAKSCRDEYYIIFMSSVWRWEENKTYHLAHHSIPPPSMNATRGLVAEDCSVLLFCRCCLHIDFDRFQHFLVIHLLHGNIN